MLHLHRAERTDRLADALADVLSSPLADPFTAEVVAVPARGVERWLTQRLSHRLGVSTAAASWPQREAGDGVCAHVDFPSPVALVAEAIEAGSGIARGEDPWRSERLVWPLLDVIDRCATEEWCATVGRYIGALPDTPQDEVEIRSGRRYATAATIARLFSDYAAQRPGMLRDWAALADVTAAGGDVGVAGGATDGAGRSLDPDLGWQAILWCRLRAVMPVPSPAERLGRACASLVADPGVSPLPARVAVFGATRLTVDQLAVLAALAAHRDVHVFVPHPSPALWQAVRRLVTVPSPLPRRRGDPTAALATHPLLASLGRDTRELQLVLHAGTPDAFDRHHPVAPGAAIGQAAVGRAAAGSGTRGLLTLLQDGIRDDRLPAVDGRPLLDAADRSLTVHACHGRSRQVEVLREVVLGMLADDATLQPRDILVMCPDIETFAPLISAGFGLGHSDPGVATHPGHRVRARLADRALRQTNPVLAVLATLLDLADARVSASAVLDLAAMPPVRYRFGFDTDQLERLRQWVIESGVRWGFDEHHRGVHGSPTSRANTWRAGLDRVLLGVVMTGDQQRYLDVALPLDDVDSGDIALAGRFAELLDRLGQVVRSLTGRRPLAEWLTALSTAMDMVAGVAEADAWQITQARRELADPMLAAAATSGGAGPLLRLPDIRALLRDRLAGRPTRANFRTGDLTVCSLVPMRSVPHRVVCLLGMDDGVLAHGGADGDDIMAADPMVGERDRRSEARQMILDAVMAAVDRLVVVYTGADERTGASLPPAVAVGELLDAAELTVRVPGGTVRDAVVIRHPLQPYDVRNFTDGALVGRGPFSFDQFAAAGARAAGGRRDAAAPFMVGPLPPAEPAATLELADLIGFLEHPVRRFLRNRLGVRLDRDAAEVADQIDVGLAPLDAWAIGDRLLQARVAGAGPDVTRQVEFRRGQLPPGALGYRLLDTAIAQVEPLAEAAARLRVGAATRVDVIVELPDGRRIVGTVPGVHDDQEQHEQARRVVRVVYSKLGPKHRLRAWLHLLVLAAAEPEQQWRAVTVGRPGQSRRGVASQGRASTLQAPSGPGGVAALAVLVDLYDRGMREPLPLATATSHAYAAAILSRATERDAVYAAGQEWLKWSENTTWGEATEAEHVLVWGDSPPLDALLRAKPLPDEAGPGWPAGGSRFGVLAMRLWSDLIAAERTELL